MIYALADRFVRSAIALPELVPAQSSHVDWTIDVGERTSSRPPGRAYQYWTTAGGQRWVTFYRSDQQRVLHFARTARFVLDTTERRVECQPVGRRGEAAWRPALLNQVFPLLLGEDRLVLHASAVATPRGAAVFAGAPGQGKSTLAAALVQRGCRLIADDFLVIQQDAGVPVALPSGLAPRLWPDSVEAILPARTGELPLVSQRSAKRVASGLPSARAPLPIASVFVLTAPAASVSVARMSFGAAVSALTATTFIGRMDERSVVRDMFERVTSLVAHVPIHRLGIEHNFAGLDKLCDTVLAALHSG